MNSQANVDVTGQAGLGTPGMLTGSVIIQNSDLQFGTGAITTIAQGAGLSMDTASISDKGTTGNTALDLSQIDTDGSLYLGDGESVTSTGSLVNSGLLILQPLESPASLTVAGNFTNNGNAVFSGVNIYAGGATAPATVMVDGNLVNDDPSGDAPITLAGDVGESSFIVDGAATGGGSIVMQGKAYLEFGSASDNPVALSATANTIKLDDPTAGYTGAITGFASGDTLDLAGEAVTIESYDGTTLTVQTASGATQSYALSGPTAGGLTTTSDENGGTDIVVVCFASGTLIRTARGDIVVEALAVGDLAVTAAGICRPIRWLGHRTIDCRRHPRPREAMPIRIAEHAFGENRPARDLFVSPGHSICVDVLGEVLIPAATLVNGTTIAQITMERVTYWHVELDSHNVVIAEGLPTESYLDMGNRRFFGEAGVVELQAAPDTRSATRAGFCRPFVADGPRLETAREQISRRARKMAYRHRRMYTAA